MNFCVYFLLYLSRFLLLLAQSRGSSFSRLQVTLPLLLVTLHSRSLSVRNRCIQLSLSIGSVVIINLSRRVVFSLLTQSHLGALFPCVKYVSISCALSHIYYHRADQTLRDLPLRDDTLICLHRPPLELNIRRYIYLSRAISHVVSRQALRWLSRARLC